MSSRIRKLSAKGIAALGSLALVGVAGVGSASAQDIPELAVPADKDWAHDWTSMVFPSRIGGFERDGISQFEERQTNVVSQYFDDSSQTILSIYIYRPGNPDTAVWFDRALIPIGAAEQYGSVDLDRMKIGTFAPTGGVAESGMFAVLAVDGNFRSTALSMYRAGEWLVKVRISSRTLTVIEMDALRRDIERSLPKMEGLDSDQAYFIEECQTAMTAGQAIPYNDPKGDIALAVEASISVAAARLDDNVEGAPAQSVYCRQGQRRDQLNIYRLNESVDSYYTAIGDAGSGFSVFAKSLYGAEPGGESAVEVYRVQSADGLNTNVHRPFVGLPSVQQAADAVYRFPGLAQVSRPLGDDETNISLLTPPESSVTND